MGDPRRFQVFYDFIQKQYPQQCYPIICCVADGKMMLSELCMKGGYHVIIYDPKIPKNKAKKYNSSSPHHIHRSCFYATTELECIPDVIVGLHPDEATVEIVEYARIHKIHVAVAPCCIVGRKEYVQQAQNKYEQWLDVISNIYTAMKRKYLHIHGRNVVLYR